MAKYKGALDVAYELLETKRKTLKGRHARLLTGKYKGYIASCKYLMIDEGDDHLYFVYWFDVFRKDGNGFLDSTPGQLREGRREEQFEWI